MSTKKSNAENPGSCWNRAKDDEPIFVLRANDESAPDIVRMWALWYKRSKGGLRVMSERQRVKYHDAVELSNQMEDWADKGGGE